MDDDEQGHDHFPLGGGQECLACPVCVLLQALSTGRPEVLQHLLAAGRELALALQAVIEPPHREPGDGNGDGRAQRIHVD